MAEWHGKILVDRNGEKIGRLQDVYVVTFVPLGGIQLGADELLVTVTKEQVRSAPDIEMHGDELSQADESALYHHFELNYMPITTESGRCLARR